MGFIYGDYTAISFTDVETSYVIGTDSGIILLSESTLLKTDQDCLVRFNSDDAVQHSIEADGYFSFDRKIHTIYVVKETTNGTLKVWSEGNILR